MKAVRNRIPALIALVSLIMALAGASVVSAAGAQITKGDFRTYAAGLTRGYDISGRALMVRTADGRTLVQVQAWGLAPDTTYPVHVHNAPCAVNNGGGHYQDVVGGLIDNVNEIWPIFTTDASGHGNGNAANDFIARPEAQAVVIHDTDGARIACADLE